MVVPQLTELVGSTIAKLEFSYGRLMVFTEQGHALRIDNQVELHISQEFDTDTHNGGRATITQVSARDDLVKIVFEGGELHILCKNENFRSPEAYEFRMPDGRGFIYRGEE
jgi:hypothetical protein